MYYIRKASSQANATKWYIHQQGGVWCTSEEDCYNRAHTSLGSSDPKYGFVDTVDLDSIIGCNGKRQCGALMANNAAINPLTCDWNVVLIVNCDGGLQLGDNATVSIVHGQPLYYRGYRNLNAVISDLLQRQQLHKATDVLVGGDSAGGLAAWIHTDLWAERLPSTARVVGVPDSGFFMDYGRWSDDIKAMYVLHNASAGINKACAAAYEPNQQWRCAFAQYTSQFSRTRMFALQSQYDRYHLDAILRSAQPNEVNAYGALLLKTLNSSLFHSGPQRRANGAFLDSCNGDYEIVIDDQTALQAFEAWYYGTTERRMWLQDAEYPCEQCCGTQEVQITRMQGVAARTMRSLQSIVTHRNDVLQAGSVRASQARFDNVTSQQLAATRAVISSDLHCAALSAGSITAPQLSVSGEAAVGVLRAASVSTATLTVTDITAASVRTSGSVTVVGLSSTATLTVTDITAASVRTSGSVTVVGLSSTATLTVTDITATSENKWSCDSCWTLVNSNADSH
eukprot:TRINITY_DN6380_c0_g2_i8.p1 TRINITY_DN6380_c0_g2~~TRINITY_DN6380_c0_g2_i8.p1  ORF type:complete len:511 (-),score=89.06 TRINITY_DN6380_c0_g2_i8:124-1656(-)